MPQRIACLAKGRVAAKDRNQGANGASKETFVLLRVKQNVCVRVCVCVRVKPCLLRAKNV